LADAPDHFIQIEWIDQDIGPEVSDREALVDHQLHDWSLKAHGDGVLEGQHYRGVPLRLSPALAWPVEVPRTGHPHVRMQRHPTLESHQQVLAVCVDGLEPPTL